MAPPRFDGERFRTQIKLAKYRLENLAKQLKNASSTRRREIATLLQQGLEDRARVNVWFNYNYLIASKVTYLNLCLWC